jgi:DnaJ-class molecular chaperone
MPEYERYPAPKPNDFYKVLGVEKGANSEQIEAAFSDLIELISNGQTATSFEQACNAYAILSDPQLKHAHDSERRHQPARELAERLAAELKQRQLENITRLVAEYRQAIDTGMPGAVAKQNLILGLREVAIQHMAELKAAFQQVILTLMSSS